MNLIQTLEAEAIEEFKSKKSIPDFRAGDTLRVGVRVVEGERTRIQNYEGVCIARSNRALGSSFTVRKISFGEGVERVFRSEEHTSELQSLMRISYAVFCLKKKKINNNTI